MMRDKKNKHYIKKIVSFLTILCCLAGSVGSLSARAGAEVSADANPRIIFTNEPKKSPDLYVSKTVVSTDGSSLPEEEKDREFEFSLKLSGAAARQAVYHLYDGSVEKENEIPAGNSANDKFRTDASGRFFLKDGQIAVFLSEDNPSILGVGVKYEVREELSFAERYRLKESANTEGSIGDKATSVRFVNEFSPRGTGTEAKLDVVKEVTFPDGYNMPQTPDFTFQLKLNNEICADTEYEILDSKSEKKTGTGKTDANGLFALQGGQTARFTQYKGEKIKTGIQYEVIELNLPANWRAVGQNALSSEETVEIKGTSGAQESAEIYQIGARETGSTEAVTKVYFENVSAAFGVKKLVEGETKPDVDFTFALTHGDRTKWPEAAYYLYNAWGNQIKNDAEDAPEDGGFATDGEGHFTLKHGETAIFYGIGAGETYNVREIQVMPEAGAEDAQADGDVVKPIQTTEQTGVAYVQTEPHNAAGYTDNIVSDNIPVWLFRNKPSQGGLTVTKAVTNQTDETAFREVDFNFTLLKGTKSETDSEYQWEPVSGEPFTRNEGGIEEEGTTGKGEKAGSFTLKADGTIVFPYLESGHYKVVENVKDTPEYSVANPDESETDEELKGLTQLVEGDYEEDSTLVFPFENQYEAWKFDLRMVKQDGEGNPLAGAEFKLYWDQEQNNPVTAMVQTADEAPGENTAEVELDGDMDAVEQLVSTFTTDENGIAIIPNLRSGKYILEEAKAPSGYALLFEPISLEVRRTETGIEVILDEGKADSNVVECTGTKVSTTNEKDLVEITVYNIRFYELPSAGGIGIYWYSIGGMLLMMAAALILYRNKHAANQHVGGGAGRL